MASSEKGVFRRYFTERPERPIDFLVTWIGICLVPLVLWPVFGFFLGSMSEGFARVFPTLITAPIGAGVVLAGVYFYRKKKNEEASAGDEKYSEPEPRPD